MMKKITTALLSMLVMTSTLTMGLPIFSNEVNAQPEEYYQDDRYMKDYEGEYQDDGYMKDYEGEYQDDGYMKDYGDDGSKSYENGPYGYDNSRPGYDDYTYKDKQEKKDLKIYDRSSQVTGITPDEGPKKVTAKCDKGDKYLSGGFTTNINVRGPTYDQLDSVPNLVKQAHDVTFDILSENANQPDNRENAGTFKAIVVCLDTNPY